MRSGRGGDREGGGGGNTVGKRALLVLLTLLCNKANIVMVHEFLPHEFPIWDL